MNIGFEAARHMNIDTAFELIELYQKEIDALNGGKKTKSVATQQDIDALLF